MREGFARGAGPEESHSRWFRLLAAAWTLTAVAGCSGSLQTATQALTHTIFAPRIYDCEGFDVPLSVFVGSSRKELQVRIRAYEVDHSFPFVVETSADNLVLVAFTPLGTKAFTVVRRGEQVDVENLLGRSAQPVPPRNVMEDVLAMSVPSGCATTSSGVAVTPVEGWEITDFCELGRPLERHIAKPGEKPEIDIEYRFDSIVVKQNRCRYNARYVLLGMPGASPQEATDRETPTVPGEEVPAKAAASSSVPAKPAADKKP